MVPLDTTWKIKIRYMKIEGSDDKPGIYGETRDGGRVGRQRGQLTPQNSDEGCLVFWKSHESLNNSMVFSNLAWAPLLNG